MTKSKNIDLEALKAYDKEIKEYINKQIAAAIKAYAAGDEINIEDYPVDNSLDDDF